MNMQEAFNINVDISGNGIELELDVFPRDTDYVIALDGVTLTTIKYQTETFPHWVQSDGNLPEDTVNEIGQKIENRLG